MTSTGRKYRQRFEANSIASDARNMIHVNEPIQYLNSNDLVMFNKRSMIPIMKQRSGIETPNLNGGFGYTFDELPEFRT